MAKNYHVGFDLGGTKMLAVLYDRDFTPVAKVRRKTKGFQGAKAGMARIEETVEKLLSEAGVGAGALTSIGIGCPGPVDPGQGIILALANLGWENVPVGPMLTKRFKCPVRVLNDVDAGTYGEYRFGAAGGAKGVLGIFPGTGVGGSYVLNGEVLAGSGISCMEVGHMCVDPGGLLCGCGRRGCLETVCSRLAIAAELAKAAYRGEAPTILEMVGTEVAQIRSGVIATAVAAGDEAVVHIVTHAASLLGAAVGNLVNVFAPDCIVLGGGLAEALPDLYMAEVARGANAHCMPPYRDRFNVCIAQLGDDAGVKGAAAWGALARRRS